MTYIAYGLCFALRLLSLSAYADKADTGVFIPKLTCVRLSPRVTPRPTAHSSSSAAFSRLVLQQPQAVTASNYTVLALMSSAVLKVLATDTSSPFAL
jgi:hypothetical protein